MRKFLSPILNIVSLILVGIAYGLAGITAAFNVNKTSIGNYYQLVWQNPNVLSVVGFFLIIAATVFVLLVFIPKCRKYTALLTAALLIAGGVLALMTPNSVQAGSSLPVYLQPGLIGMASLLFSAAFLSLIIAAIEFTSKE